MEKLFRFTDVGWDRRLYFHMAVKDGGKVFVARAPQLEEVKDNVISDEPFLKLDREDGQRIMDALWDCGLRPSEGSGSAGSLAATERHLKDMRDIVFNCLLKGRIPG